MAERSLGYDQGKDGYRFFDPDKRIDRFLVSLPEDWGGGYDNVNIGCTVENQAKADERLPLFLSYPIKRRFIACAPLLEGDRFNALS